MTACTKASSHPKRQQGSCLASPGHSGPFRPDSLIQNAHWLGLVTQSSSTEIATEPIEPRQDWHRLAALAKSGDVGASGGCCRPRRSASRYGRRSLFRERRWTPDRVRRCRAEAQFTARAQTVRRAHLELVTGNRAFVVDRAAPGLGVTPSQSRALGAPASTGYEGHRPPSVQVLSGDLGMGSHGVVRVDGDDVEGAATARTTSEAVEGGRCSVFQAEAPC